MQPIEWQLLEAGFCRHPELMTIRGGATGAAEFPALVGLLQHPGRGRILFDTGYADHFVHATSGFPDAMYRWVTPVTYEASRSVVSQLGAQADSVGDIVISHFHGDHVAGLRDFPTARLHCSREAWDDLRSRSRFSALRKGLLPALLPDDFALRANFFEDCSRCDLPAELRPFTTGFDVFGDGSVLAVALPGHAAGHFGITFRDPQDRTVFLVADAAWSMVAIETNTPPPAVTSAWLGDTARYRESLAMLHELHCRSPQVLIVPAHCRRWRGQPAQ
jgi:glyoxylase-like metal-dependent hydrolase (beta-lactamase superfamily II)